MKVKCPTCGYEFDIFRNDINVTLGEGIPFVSCRRKMYRWFYGAYKEYRCGEFIDLRPLLLDDSVVWPTQAENTANKNG